MAAWAALIPVAMSAAQQVMKSQQEKGAAAEANAMSMENIAFQREQANRQYELATAGRTNARGDKVMYIPGQGWVTINSPDTASRIGIDNALARKEAERQLSTGEAGRNRDVRRRIDEGVAAEPLLTQFANGFGLPTREGVRGKQKVADATAATEGADNIRRAATSTALRTGGKSRPLGANLASLDKGATAGLRTALARSDATADPMFEAMYKSAAGNKLDPYNMLATRAGGETPYKPESISGDVTSMLGQAATVGAMRGGQGGAGVNAATQGGVATTLGRGALNGPQYDAMAAAMLDIFKKRGGGGDTLPTEQTDRGAW